MKIEQLKPKCHLMLLFKLMKSTTGTARSILEILDFIFLSIVNKWKKNLANTSTTLFEIFTPEWKSFSMTRHHNMKNPKIIEWLHSWNIGNQNYNCSKKNILNSKVIFLNSGIKKNIKFRTSAKLDLFKS